MSINEASLAGGLEHITSHIAAAWPNSVTRWKPDLAPPLFKALTAALADDFEVNHIAAVRAPTSYLDLQAAVRYHPVGKLAERAAEV